MCSLSSLFVCCFCDGCYVDAFPSLLFKTWGFVNELVMSSRVTRSRREPPQQDDQARARWTTSLTKILADLMIQQVQKGNRQKNSFSKKAWRYISDEFYKKTGLKWDKEQLKNRYAVLRRQYITVKSLLDQSDFSWDEFTGTIIAKDEAWTEYIRVCCFYICCLLKQKFKPA